MREVTRKGLSALALALNGRQEKERHRLWQISSHTCKHVNKCTHRCKQSHLIILHTIVNYYDKIKSVMKSLLRFGSLNCWGFLLGGWRGVCTLLLMHNFLLIINQSKNQAYSCRLLHQQLVSSKFYSHTQYATLHILLKPASQISSFLFFNENMYISGITITIKPLSS